MEETDDERMQVTESTDTEMYQTLERDLVVNVTHDREARQVKSVAFIQAKAAEQAVSDMQVEFYETTDTRQVLLKRHSEEREEDPKQRPSPQTRVCHEERGRCILKKKTANTPTDTPRQPHPGTHTPGPFGVGSLLARLYEHEATNAQVQSTRTFQTKMKDCYDSYTESRSRSRKQEHQTIPKTVSVTPTQSPLQKTVKLKSIMSKVQKAPVDQGKSHSQSCNRRHDQSRARQEEPVQRAFEVTYSSAPYHLMDGGKKDAKEFLLYLTNRFTRDYFGPEITDLGRVFKGQTAYMARWCMVMAVYFEVVWVQGVRWVFPLIPDAMTDTPPHRGAALPPTPTEGIGRNPEQLGERCLFWWWYFLALIQFWKDETCSYVYGEPIRDDSKLMLFVFFRLRTVLKKAVSFELHHFAIKNSTPWNDVMKEQFNNKQLVDQRKVHQRLNDELTALKSWMHLRYEAEAEVEYKELMASEGDFDKLKNHRDDPCRCPGDEAQFNKEMRAKATKYPLGVPTSGQNLACHQQREKEAQECHEYARQ